MEDIQCEIAVTREIEVEVFRVAHMGGAPYKGDYVVTPGDEAQELPTAGKSPAQNIIVEAIPSNYGKIGWDGARLTVS